VEQTPTLVLDYASPRPRVKVRLAANSVLHEDVVDGRCVITEVLSGKAQAAGAFVFSAFVLLVMSFSALDTPGNDRRFMLRFVGVVATIMISLALLIVRNTWRRTVLFADCRSVSVTFTGPLSASRRYQSPAASIEKIEVVGTDAAGRLGELRIAPLGGAELHLFTDHLFMDVQRIANNVAAAIREGGTATVLPTAGMALATAVQRSTSWDY
jgi:hypothetical protein